MKIKINVEEIEFEDEAGQGGGKGRRTIEFSFHDQLRIKGAFESELARLFMDTKNDKNGNFSIRSILKRDGFSIENYGNINLIKEIDGGEFSLSAGNRNPSQVGKRLAKSIYSSLNLL